MSDHLPEQVADQVADFVASLNTADFLTVLIAINFFAFTAFGLDKSAAERGLRRIRESTLLGWALVGGTLGAYAGRWLFRHKTRKQPFNNRLLMIALVQVAVGIGCFVYVSGL